jgi:diguanylate cyclase (GGDEF)-like protein
MTRAARFAALGALLGTGAPLGALALAVAFRPAADPLADRIRIELLAHAFFYAYMAVGTVTAFAVAGWVVGRIADRLAAMSAHYEELALEDALTGLPNRRALERRFREEAARARRSGSPLSCLVLDLDRFKALNDRFGHAAGDAVLRSFGALLKRMCRQHDFATRSGGEEFVVLLPATGPEVAREVAERIRAAAESREHRIGGETVRVTVSVGVASSLPEDADGHALFRRADAAMYRAKQEGRNRVAQAL